MKHVDNKRRASCGLALVAVLWIVAAMGLIVTGVVKSLRTEIVSSGHQRLWLQSMTQADAAILLALQKLYAQTSSALPPTQAIHVSFSGQEHLVMINSLNGLIDINNAEAPLLAQLFAVAGGLNAENAQALAQATVQIREAPNPRGVQSKFDATEDLLGVPGISYDLYVIIQKLITADLKDGSGRVNPMAAPLQVLEVLTGGDAYRAAALYANRNSPLTGMDTTVLNPAFIDTSVSSSLRLEVSIPVEAGSILTRIWDVLGAEDRRTGLPWRILGKSHVLSSPVLAGNP